MCLLLLLTERAAAQEAIVLQGFLPLFIWQRFINVRYGDLISSRYVLSCNNDCKGVEVVFRPKSMSIRLTAVVEAALHRIKCCPFYTNLIRTEIAESRAHCGL